MENLSLADAFVKLNAKAANRLNSRSAMSKDGAMVLSCSKAFFAHPSRGVLRYEDRLSRDSAEHPAVVMLGQHLTLARDGDLPIRMIVVEEKQSEAGKTSRNIHTRADLIGKLTKFDGDHFIIDFVRTQDGQAAASASAARAGKRLSGA